jgi:PleD family two-component response regulator
MLKFLTSGNVEAQYHEEIYRLMTLDGLTQLHNRRAFQETLDREFSRSKRYGHPFSLVIFDIDHFKRINDAHGHLAATTCCAGWPGWCRPRCAPMTSWRGWAARSSR